MIGFGSHLRSGKPRTRSGISVPVALLCVALLALLAFVQVTHLHTNQTDADQCPLCIVMHSAAPVTVAAAIVVLVPVGASTQQVEPRSVAHKPQSSLFIRPPPAGC